MENISIKIRLVGLVGFLLLIVIGIGLFGMISTHNIIEHLEEDAHKEQEYAHTLELAEKTEIVFKSQVIEWKNILLRGNNSTKFYAHKKRYNKKVKEVKADFKKLYKKYKKLGLDAAEIENVEGLYLEVNEKYESGFKKYDRNNPKSGKILDNIIKDIDVPVAEAFEKMAAHLSKEIDEIILKSEEYAVEVESSTKNTDVAIILISVIVGLVFGILLIRSIVNPLNKIIKVMESLASGDMSVSIEVHGNNEISLLQKAVSRMNKKLSEVLGQVRNTADNVTTSAQEISDGNLDLSSRTEEQAASIEETSSSMEQITDKVNENSDSAKQAVILSSTATDKAEHGLNVAKDAVSAINEIKASSEKVADIIGVIDEIAFQTNLLALNASIEAERAGEQGRGFSVVANEVQKLAQRSADAANEIKALIKNSSEKVLEGTELVKSSSIALEDIVKTSSETNTIMNSISSASQEQAAALSQVNIAMTQMEQATQENAALVEETSAASTSLSDQAKYLSDIISFFKLEKGHVSEDHGIENDNKTSQSPITSKKREGKKQQVNKSGDDWNEF